MPTSSQHLLHHTLTTTCMVVALCILSTQSALAEDWAHWRGPNFDGSSTATNLPTDFSPTKNVKWVADLPGPSAATPIIVGNRVFLSSTDPDNQDLLAICLDRATGSEVWRRIAGSGYQTAGQGNRLQLDNRSDYASPSPVAADGRVIFFYGNGDLTAFDYEGNQLWTRNIQKDYGDFAFQWTFSASPTLYNSKLYIQVLQRNQSVRGRGPDGADSYLLAINPADGQTIWKQNRPAPARQESLESYTTPIPFTHNGRDEILVTGGDIITSHNPETGEELWRWGTWNPGHQQGSWRLVPSPVAGAGMILVCGPKNAPVFGIPAGLNGPQPQNAAAWDSGSRSPITTDVPTPLFYNGKFFVLNDLGNVISRVNPATGEAEWTTNLSRRARWRSSPTAADGKIYFMNHYAEVIVIDVESGEILHEIDMASGRDDNIRASIPAVDNELFIRTFDKLYCIAAQ